MSGNFLNVDGLQRRLLDADTITQSLFLAVAREACSTYGRLSEKRARIKSPAIAANRKLLLLASTIGPLVVSLAFEVGHKTLDSAVGLTLETAAFNAGRKLSHTWTSKIYELLRCSNAQSEIREFS